MMAHLRAAVTRVIARGWASRNRVKRVRLQAMRALWLVATLLSAGCGSHERVPIGSDDQPAAPSPSCEVAGVEPLELTLLGPSDRSHWLQPWRAYRDTWPAVRMQGAAGYQVAFPPDPVWVGTFAASGFRHVTMEVGWDRIGYDGAADALSPDTVNALQALATQAKQGGFRPMLLLNAPGISGPSKPVTVTLTEAASVGTRALRMSAQDAQQLTVHKAFLPGGAAPVVDSVAGDGTVQLSRPLPRALPAGALQLRLLRYAPFTRPSLPDGSANPEFEETLNGWLSYLTAVSSKLRDALGSEQFDIELWNETAAGNNYETFDINTLYDPPLEADRPQSFDENLSEIRARSVAWLRAPERHLGSIGVSDGSANMRFSVSAASEPEGMTALSRHVSAQGKRFPEDANLGATPSVDGRGAANGALDGDAWVEAFTPSYDALFPEQALTALYPPDARRPGQFVRDLSSIASLDARSAEHVRAALVGGVPLPDVWLTALSTNLGLSDKLGLTLTPADRLHLQAKALLRSFSAYVGAGAGLLSIYGPDQDTVRYFDLDEPDGGEALVVLQRFFARFEGDAMATASRQLELVSVSACAPGREFDGDGTAAFPDLGHRQLVAFFPFQRGPRDLVVPAYVMTRNLLKVYAEGEGSSRFDMPAEDFQLTLRGLAPATAHASAFDPVANTTRPVELRRVGNDVVLSVALYDYPLLLELGD
jgi:hypothetical protein